MGAFNLLGMFEAGADFESALSWHLKANHYPPVPDSMFAPCLEAIIRGADEDYDALVELPEGVLWRGETSAPAYAIIEGHHLDLFVEQVIARNSDVD